MLLAALVIHEAAHALALRRQGIAIVEAGLGLPFFPRVKFRIPGVPFDISLSIWLVGAYVKPDPTREKDINAMPYREHAWFLNAGVISNLITAATAISFVLAWTGHLGKALIALVVAILLWEFRKFVASVLLPLASIPAMIWLVYILISAWTSGHTGLGMAGIQNVDVPSGLANVLFMFGVLNFFLAALNTVPLHGIDNGRVVALLLRRWKVPTRWVTVYEISGYAAVGSLMLVAIGSDLWAAGTALI
jgi:membrane-associated protease RseP (regulator of RpoE activity)